MVVGMVTQKEMEQLKDIFVPYKDLDKVLTRHSKETVRLLQPTLDSIDERLARGNERFDEMEERCEERSKVCPALNIDAKIAYDKKVREAKQEEELDETKHFFTRSRLLIGGAIILITSVIAGVTVVILKIKEIIP